MAKRLAKRFYEQVTATQAEDEGWAILLDGRRLKTPGKLALGIPNAAIAELVRAEWDAQTEQIDPSKMPVTRLLNVASERTPENRDDIVSEARRYAETDLLCFREQTVRILRERQAQAWDSWLDWAARRGVVLRVATGALAVNQEAASLDGVATYAAGLDDLRLTLFAHFGAVYSSSVLGMAVMERALGAEAAFDLSRIDEVYQIEMWGQDEEAGEIIDDLRAETLAISRVLEAL